jgi:hypothetical protein
MSKCLRSRRVAAGLDLGSRYGVYPDESGGMGRGGTLGAGECAGQSVCDLGTA